MAGLFKVIGGTRGASPLCPTCRNALIVKGHAESQEAVFCDFLNKYVPFMAVECGKYDDKRLPSLQSMRENCFVLEPDKKELGFKGNARWRKADKVKPAQSNPRFDGDED